MHPLDELLKRISSFDFAVLEHGFTEHGRDYVMVLQDSVGSDPGTYRVSFTHSVWLECETRVRDEVWRQSWDDVFTDYAAWEAAGSPPGYVFGVNWADGYPGLKAVPASSRASDWSRRLGVQMYEAVLETNQFMLSLVFHALVVKKISDDTPLIAKTIIPLRPV